MAYNEELTKTIREALSDVPKVEEKKMFGGVTFMVDNKMCISAGDNKIMCRIDPGLHEEVIKKKGCETVKMKGRDYKGYVYVDMDEIKNNEDLKYWIRLVLDYNKTAKASKKSYKTKSDASPYKS